MSSSAKNKTVNHTRQGGEFMVVKKPGDVYENATSCRGHLQPG